MRSTPSAPRRIAKTRPIDAAITVARSKRRVIAQRMERRSAPAVQRECGQEIEESQQQVDDGEVAEYRAQPAGRRQASGWCEQHPSPGTPPAASVASQKTPARTRLVNGPTAEIRNSSRAVRASPMMFETPPKMNSVMSRTRMPSARATSEWLSSCTSTHANSRTVGSPPGAAASNPVWRGATKLK